MRKYSYYFVRKRVNVTAGDGTVVAETNIDPAYLKDRIISLDVVLEKERKAKKNKRNIVKMASPKVAMPPEVVATHMRDLMSMVALKTCDDLSRYVKSGLSELRTCFPSVSMSRVNSITFSFDFVATFCVDDIDENVAGFAVCSVVDDYSRGQGMRLARKRLDVARTVLNNGNSGKTYKIKGIITADGIGAITV